MKLMSWVVMLVAGGAVAYLWIRARRMAVTKMRAMDLTEDDQFLLSDPEARYLGDPECGDAASERGFLVLTRRELVFVARDGGRKMHIPRKRISAVDRDPPRLTVRFEGSGDAAAKGVVGASWNLLHAEGWYRGLTAGPGVMRVPTSLPAEDES